MLKSRGSEDYEKGWEERRGEEREMREEGDGGDREGEREGGR